MQPTLARAVTTDGVSIAWTSAGDGPALIHLPGVPLSNTEAEWRIPVLRHAYTALAGEVRLVQYDGRGTGRSQRDVVDVSLEAFLRDLDAVVEAAGARRFVLLGFYHSAAHAIAYAMRVATELGPSATVLVNLSGRGDKDVQTVEKRLAARDQGLGIGD